MKPTLPTPSARARMEGARGLHLGAVKADQEAAMAATGRYQTLLARKASLDPKLEYTTIRLHGALGGGCLLEWRYNDGGAEWLKREVIGLASAGHLACDWQQSIPSLIAPLLPGIGRPPSNP